jgi:hypothetical protein
MRGQILLLISLPFANLQSNMLSQLTSWPVIAIAVPILIGIGVGVMSMNPPDFSVAKSVFALSAAILSLKVAYWMAKSGSRPLERMVLGFVIFGTVGVLAVESWKWVDRRRMLIASELKAEGIKDTPPTSGNLRDGHGIHESVTVVVKKTVPVPDSPSVILSYSWKSGAPDHGIKAVNDGNKDAINLVIPEDVQRGNWRIKFKAIDYLKKQARPVALVPVELRENTPAIGKLPFFKKNPTFAEFLKRVAADKNISSAVDPVEITIRMLYQGSNSSDTIESHAVVRYSRSTQSANLQMLGPPGKMVTAKVSSSNE